MYFKLNPDNPCENYEDFKEYFTEIGAPDLWFSATEKLFKLANDRDADIEITAEDEYAYYVIAETSIQPMYGNMIRVLHHLLLRPILRD